MMKVERFPAVYVRGGTSRAIVFRWSDLPVDRTRWDEIFASALGSPDDSGRQLDGLGGGITSLSKIAVAAPSVRPDCDVDYHFFQIDPRSGRVQTLATCGNVVSAIGPFAVANGWARTSSSRMATVRIFDINSGMRIESRFATDDDAVDLISIDGVPGQAPAIELTFLAPAGSVSRGLFPTGHRSEALMVEGLGELTVTLIDATLPTVVVEAAQVGLHGDESPASLSDPRILEQMESLRIAAGLRMGITDSEALLRTEMANIPDVAVVSSADPDAIQARFFSGGAAHKAAPVTSSIALACACHLTGTVAAGLAGGGRGGAATWQIRNPAGTLEVRVAADQQGTRIESARVTRTSRVVMEGHIVLPSRPGKRDQP